MKRKVMRKGFTLVELLIVIIVIGVLSAMMMFSSTEAVSSAKAARIINDLTVLKKVVISWYLDNYEKVKENEKGDYVVKVGNNTYYLGQFVQNKSTGGEKEFLKYLGNAKNIKLTKDNETKPGEYLMATEENQWFVGYDLGSDMRLREKVAGRAKSHMLQGATKKRNKDGSLSTDTEEMHLFTANDQKVYMLIMKF